MPLTILAKGNNGYELEGYCRKAVPLKFFWKEI